MRQVATKVVTTVALTAAATLSALILVLWCWHISPLLPERGGATCFAAEYNPPRPVDLSSPRRDRQSVGEVKSMKLEISLDPDERPYRGGSGGYDWRYSLRLDAELTDGDRLSTTAICEWRDHFLNAIVPELSCYIDCDGGGVTVWRRIGQSALSARFEAGERLKTGGSCGSGGTTFIGAEKEARSFPVEAVAAGQCK